MRIICLIFSKLKRLFSKKLFNSSTETHWVNHIYDHYVAASKAAVGGWINLHGFEENSSSSTDGEGGWVYWIEADMRSFGIRVQDVLIRCKKKSTYQDWIDYIWQNPDGLVRAVERDPDLFSRWGNDVNTNFIFRWGGESKNFNIHLSGDEYGMEK